VFYSGDLGEISPCMHFPFLERLPLALWGIFSSHIYLLAELGELLAKEGAPLVKGFFYLHKILHIDVRLSSTPIGRIICEEIGHFIGGSSLILSQGEFISSRAHILSLGPSFAEEIM
jgi:hypothetical protein